jgi:poly-gamma-glutamate capsule biosynthesis protein CapA/YwtB (metallophosphatase superfamily)
MRLASILTVTVFFIGIFFVKQIIVENPVSLFVSVGEVSQQSSVAQSVTEEVSLPEKQQKVLFVGDVMLARDVEKKMRRYGTSYPYRHMTDLFESHAFQVANFEGSIPKTHIPTESMKFQFSVEESLVSGFTHASFTHASLANNHSFDFGVSGYNNTQAVLAQEGIQTFGRSYAVSSSSVTDIALDDQNIGIIGIDLVLSTPSDEELVSLFEMASDQYQFVIVYVHWGVEYELLHSKQQELYAKRFVALGADMVIGHHPHVVQDIQVYDGVPVFYSLGNFIFDQYFSGDVQKGLALSATFDERVTIELFPVSTLGTKITPRLIDGFERGVFLDSLAKRSDPELMKAIRSGELTF